jgi:hypothetical protein
MGGIKARWTVPLKKQHFSGNTEGITDFPDTDKRISLTSPGPTRRSTVTVSTGKKLKFEITVMINVQLFPLSLSRCFTL